MAVEYNYEADPDEYAADLRRHFAANGGTSKAEWKKHLIGKGGESLAKRRQPVLDRQAAEDQSENTRLKKRREEAEEERRAAAGEPPLRSRKTRADGSSWKTSNSRRRLTLADFPAIRDQWHPTKNPAGEDPDKVRAALKETRWWQCPVDATHVWDATVESRTRRDSTCPFCTNRMACRTNSLARLFPEIAVLWHPTENGGLTPNEVLPALLRRSRGCARAATRSARP
ncbi:MAG: zinc-ribbon domain-containing protein [Chloroflexota bacterium]